jgi:hypothetical protein
MTGVTLLFTVSKGPGDIPKMQSQTQLSSHPKPLIWGMPPPRVFTFHITLGCYGVVVMKKGAKALNTREGQCIPQQQTTNHTLADF